MEDVRVLRVMVERHMRQNYVFTCLTDDCAGAHEAGINYLPLMHDLPGWWSKLEVFRPSVVYGMSAAIYLDLDVVIMGDLSPLTHTTSRGLTMVEDFIKKGSGNSSVMSWRADFRHVLRRMVDSDRGFIHTYDRIRPNGRIGDQAFIEDSIRMVDGDDAINFFDPGEVISYKMDVMRGRVEPHSARVVTFHGRPKPADVSEEWVTRARRL